MDPVGTPLSSFILPELYFALLTHRTLTAALGIAPGNPRNLPVIGPRAGTDAVFKFLLPLESLGRTPIPRQSRVSLRLAHFAAIWPGPSHPTPLAFTTAHG